jgi:hypothetical protein
MRALTVDVAIPEGYSIRVVRETLIRLCLEIEDELWGAETRTLRGQPEGGRTVHGTAAQDRWIVCHPAVSMDDHSWVAAI